jgi:hypothetical protein
MREHNIALSILLTCCCIVPWTDCTVLQHRKCNFDIVDLPITCKWLDNFRPIAQSLRTCTRGTPPLAILHIVNGTSEQLPSCYTCRAIVPERLRPCATCCSCCNMLSLKTSTCVSVCKQLYAVQIGPLAEFAAQCAKHSDTGVTSHAASCAICDTNACFR